MSAALILLGNGPYISKYIALTKKHLKNTTLIVCSRNISSLKGNDYVPLRISDKNAFQQITGFIQSKKYNVRGVINRLDYCENLHGKLVEHFRINGPTADSIQALAIKSSLDELMIKSGLAFYRPHTIHTEFNSVEKTLKHVQFPVVVKSSIGAKSRGVFLLNSSRDYLKVKPLLEKHMRNMFPQAPHKRVGEILIEKYIKGRQVTPVSYVDKTGKFHLISLVDVVTAREVGQNHMQLVFRSTPSEYKESIRQKIEFVMQKLVTASGLKSTCLHPEFIVVNKNIYLIEVNVRIGGFRAELMKNAYNLDLNLISFQLALGKKVNDQIDADRTCTACEIWLENGGTVSELRIPKSKHIVSLKEHFKKGDVYSPPPYANKPLATFFVSHPNDSKLVARKIYNKTVCVFE